MSRLALLDSGPLGLISHPRNHVPLEQWTLELARSGTRVVVPEIADYEVRRELIRAGRIVGVRRLDALKTWLGFARITSDTLLKAAELWAESRRIGRPTSDPAGLDIDVILAAQALILIDEGHDVTIATTNVGHLTRFVSASRWEEIS